MNYFEFAHCISRGNANFTVSLRSIKVWGMLLKFDATTGVVLDIQSGDGTTTYGRISAGTARTFPIDIPWVADKGLKFTHVSGDPATVVDITVFHSQEGA